MKTALALIFVICSIHLVHSKSNNKTYPLLIGSYTSSSTNDGIYVYDFNSQTGEVNLKSKVSGEENPSKFKNCLSDPRDGSNDHSV